MPENIILPRFCSNDSGGIRPISVSAISCVPGHKHKLCMYIFAVDRKRNGHEEEEEEEDGDFDFQPPSRADSAEASTFAQREREKSESLISESEVLHCGDRCTHCAGRPNARTFSFLPPSRDCSNSAGEIETRFAYLASPCNPRHANTDARVRERVMIILERIWEHCTNLGVSQTHYKAPFIHLEHTY